MANDGTVTIGTLLDDSGIKTGLQKLGSTVGTLSKGMAVAIGTATTAVAGLSAMSVKAYADYEQLVGGVETLFKNSSVLVQRYADNAYKTAGLSANQYMETVTSFSASLLQSLGGDTQKSAEVAHKAVVDMSDNANKMGTQMELIQNAYQGFAKSNFTMLDNLKLGYGGTKSEMERLIQDANKVKEANGEMANLSIDSFADMVEAIHIIQTEIGITGTTALEAEATITGSANAMKAAWQNLLVGMSNENADFATLVENLVESIVTYANNVLPRLETSIEGIGKLIEELAPVAFEKFLPILLNVLTSMVDTVLRNAPLIIQSLSDGIIRALPVLWETTKKLLSMLLQAFIDYFPQIVTTGIEMINKFSKGLRDNNEEVVNTIGLVLGVIINSIVDNMPKILETGVNLIVALIQGFQKALPQIVSYLPYLIQAGVDTILYMMPVMAQAGYDLIVSLFNYAPAMAGALVSSAVNILWILISNIGNFYGEMANVGMNLVQGIWTGISNMAGWIQDKILGFAKGITNSIKSFFGIHSPSRLFRDEIGAMLGEGLVIGFENVDAMSQITDSLQSGMGGLNTMLNLQMSDLAMQGSNYNQTINFNQAIQGPDDVARAMRMQNLYGLAG